MRADDDKASKILFSASWLLPGSVVLAAVAILAVVALGRPVSPSQLSLQPDAEADRQFRLWAREQQEYAKKLPPLPPPGPARPFKSKPAEPDKPTKPTKPRASRPEPKSARKSAPAGKSAPPGAQPARSKGQPGTLESLEKLTKNRSLDELAGLLEKPSSPAGLEELKALVDRLRAQGHGSARITVWVLSFDCSGDEPRPGYSARIKLPNFDLHFGLYVTPEGKERFALEEIDPARQAASCQDPRNLWPGLYKNRI